MKWLVDLVGYASTGLGLGMVVVNAIGMMDPIGAQLSNDADPFGTPPSTDEVVLKIAIGVVIFAIGFWLTRSKRKA